MTQPKRNAPRSPKPTQERSIDRMVEDTFPASDATQLPGRADGAPHSSASAGEARHDAASSEAAPREPRTIGNQGVPPATRMLEETVRITDTGALTMRFDPELRRLLLHFSEDGMTLDAEAVDRLIDVLSAKRALLTE